MIRVPYFILKLPGANRRRALLRRRSRRQRAASSAVLSVMAAVAAAALSAPRAGVLPMGLAVHAGGHRLDPTIERHVPHADGLNQ
jgi:hypothetical protein